MEEITNQPVIKVENLCKSYDEDPVLKNISFNVEKGDLVSIIGPSGCGKSTLLRCLNCLDVFDYGSLTICDISLHRKSPTDPITDEFYRKAHEIREQIGMVFQGLNLFPHKTILESVMLGPIVVKKMSKEQAEANAVNLLKKVGLGNYLTRYPTNLSGGQCQRAAIARALAMNPKIMLYDEPTSSLDPQLVEEVLQVMRDIDAEGMTQLIVTQELMFAKDASDYIIYMENGEIVEISDEDEIFITPKDERTRKFLKKFAIHEVK